MSKQDTILSILQEIAEAPIEGDTRSLQEMLRSKLARLPKENYPTGTTVRDRTPESRRHGLRELLEEEQPDPVDLYGPGRIGPFGLVGEDPYPVGGSLLPTELSWGLAALPANRPGGDTCAWMRPASSGSYGYCYVEPINPPMTSVSPTITPVSLTQENQEGLIKVTFWGAGYAQPAEPNVRGGQLVPFIRVGGIAMGIGYLDKPIGSVVTGFNATLVTGGPPDGWALMTDTDTSRMPNTDATTLGAEITNGNVLQTLFASSGDQDFAGVPDDEEFPTPGAVGAVDVAFQRFVHAPNGNPGDYFNVYASYFIAAQRVN